ncbi:response regulator [Paenibacillus sp. sptzw28]|uniref:response regulator n=1 Tax=Paenibacillus sp. sptzw28 TaxID=715179 RepID=UPI0028694528|nr:response regulator [Paenibacillus sp. sptzw28]
MLLVDDERIILEGISGIVDWNACGTELVATARNGLEAKEVVERERPDIIITDIRMPGMDGLQLVEHVHEADPSVCFIMLSGHGDFNYARTAMRFGVKHYLLKPCNEKSIMDAIREIVEDLERRLSREMFLQSVETELRKVMPHAREQFLKELVTNKTYGRRDWDDFSRMFGIPVENQTVRLLLFRLEGDYDYEHLFALKNIAEDLLGKPLLLSTTIGKQVLMLLKDSDELEAVFAQVDSIKRTFTNFYKLELTAAISEPDEITGARRMYRETLECLEHRFYLGEGSLITKKDVAPLADSEAETFLYDEENVCLHIRSGRWSEAERELESFFESLSGHRFETAIVKSYIIPLYVAVVRQGDAASMNGYLKMLAHLDELETLQAMREFIFGAARQICKSNEELHQHKRSDIIAKVLGCIEANLPNQRLSLGWVASEMLYMNADYLGKLFKKETGEKFSNFVTRRRMEKAMQLIGQMDDVKVFELAELLGFGDNPQYFSQVFKKHTGYSPTDYKRWS